MIVTKMLAAAAAAAALITGPVHPTHHSVRYPCGKTIQFRHPESLDQFVTVPTSGQSRKQLRVLAGHELSVIAYCDNLPPGQWTPRISKLIRGDYGQDIFTARMPAGTRFWPMCDACD
jgi:hypothetical protein